MAVRDVEKDIENAVKAVLEAQIDADGIMGVTFRTLTGGAPGEEPQKPYVFIACRPLNYKGGGTDQWDGELSIDIHTQHLTSYDRDATGLVEIMGSVAYALDYNDFSASTERVGAVNLRRTGGSYDFDKSHNIATIDVTIIKACNSK